MIVTKIKFKIPDVINRYNVVLKDYDIVKIKPNFIVNEEGSKIVRNELKFYRRPFIGIIPGARKKSRKWKYYKELSGYLNGNVFIFGSKDEEREFSFIPRIKGFFGLNLDLLKAYLSYLDIVIGNDSGAIHLAQAVGTKVIMIYCSSIPEFGAKPFYGDYLSKDIPCKPCSLHGTNLCLLNFKCIETVKPEDVLVKMKEMGL